MSLSTERNYPESLKNRRLTEVITGNNVASATVLNECYDDDDTIRDISEIDDAYWSTSSSLTKKGFHLIARSAVISVREDHRPNLHCSMTTCLRRHKHCP